MQDWWRVYDPKIIFKNCLEFEIYCIERGSKFVVSLFDISGIYNSVSLIFMIRILKYLFGF